MRLLIKDGRVLDPGSDIDGVMDVLVENGVITGVGTVLPATNARVLDARGKVVCPGLIDMHVHLREPGQEAKETIATGTRAAAKGGFTAVAAMPNTSPVADNRAVIEAVRWKAAADGVVRVYPVGAMTKGSQGGELSEIGDLRAAGAVALSDDGKPVISAEVMRRVLEYSGMFDLPCICHCEDVTLSNDGLMHEGLHSTILGLKGIPRAAEEIMVARDIILAEMIGARVHIAHVSTAGSVQLVREAKRRGVAVTAEVTPHHFTLTDQAVYGYNTSTKVNPPLRSEADRAALWEGLADGTIDVIATDHAPHTLEEKDMEYAYAPFGMVGLETALTLVITELVGRGVLTLRKALEKLTVSPARILGLPEPKIEVGATADLTVINPEAFVTVNPLEFLSKGRNTPFSGYRGRGEAWATIVGGRIVVEQGHLVSLGSE